VGTRQLLDARRPLEGAEVDDERLLLGSVVHRGVPFLVIDAWRGSLAGRPPRAPSARARMTRSRPVRSQWQIAIVRMKLKNSGPGLREHRTMKRGDGRT
jgi:hypothetical protein